MRQPVKLMKGGWYMKDGVRIVQPMTIMSTAGEMEPKGLKLVLTERGLLDGKLKLDCKDKASVRSDCCSRHMMAAQPDFKEQQSILYEYLATTDHLCDFLPKFHCELAPVECFWGYAKRNCRINCDYSIHALRTAVPKYLSEVPLASIRRYFRKCWHLMQAYRLGAGFKLAQFMHQKFKTHRSLTEPRLNAIISELLEQGVAVDLLERAPSAPPASYRTVQYRIVHSIQAHSIVPIQYTVL